MNTKPQSIPEDTSASPLASEVFTDGRSKILSIELSLESFLTNEDSRMKAFIELYREHCSNGRAPISNAIPPEEIARTGMMHRTHCLRIDLATKTFRFAVWAQDANFDGHRSLQNMAIVDGSPFPILTKIVRKQLSIILDHGRPAFFEVRGIIDDRYYYFTKAILPLRNEQGEIIKCFVPFTDKIPEVPPDLREEFCAQAIE